jgi:hypothetical protein
MALPVVTLAEADAYFLNTPRNAEWVALTDQQIWLNEAQRLLGALCFDEKADCCGRTFATAWTEAISELALALSKNPTAATGGSSAAGIKKAQLGGLSVEYFEGAAQSTKVGGNAPLVLQAFPWLTDTLGCWLKTATGSNRILERVRS